MCTYVGFIYRLLPIEALVNLRPVFWPPSLHFFSLNLFHSLLDTSPVPFFHVSVYVTVYCYEYNGHGEDEVSSSEVENLME